LSRIDATPNASTSVEVGTLPRAVEVGLITQQQQESIGRLAARGENAPTAGARAGIEKALKARMTGLRKVIRDRLSREQAQKQVDDDNLMLKKMWDAEHPAQAE
jgi:hypothetical protein